MTVNSDLEYRPTEDEPFMNERQREYFRHKLLAWKEDILRESRETLEHLQDENNVLPDLVDAADIQYVEPYDGFTGPPQQQTSNWSPL